MSLSTLMIKQATAARALTAASALGRSPLNLGLNAKQPQLAVPARMFSMSHPVRIGDDKPSNPEFHRHSTRYRVSPRSVLKQLEDIRMPHYTPVTYGDKIALWIVKKLRTLSDVYFKDRLVQRAVMLETIAAVPGMVAGMAHHARSLRRMEHCQWIKPTMDEAENERMHLMTFMEVLQPNWVQRVTIVAAQGAFMTTYALCYTLFPKTSHRFVGYLEEEACSTYSHMLDMIDSGKIENVAAPPIAISYWGLPADAKLRDVVLVVRADEADHRLVNHHLSNLFKVKELKRPWDAFPIDLDLPHQLPEEQQNAAGRTYAEYTAAKLQQQRQRELKKQEEYSEQQQQRQAA